MVVVPFISIIHTNKTRNVVVVHFRSGSYKYAHFTFQFKKVPIITKGAFLLLFFLGWLHFC